MALTGVDLELLLEGGANSSGAPTQYFNKDATARKSKTAGTDEGDLDLKQVPVNIAGFLTQGRWRL